MASSDPTTTRVPTYYDWASTDFVRQHIEASAQYVAERHADFCRRWYSYSSLESPLEVIFGVWWRALDASGQIDTSTVSYRPQVEVEASSGRKYRLDFALTPAEPMLSRATELGVSIPRICVELDGHDFHERTKEQVAYRNRRDRDLQADGWKVLHYSGSELHRDPAGCVEDAWGQAYQAFGFDFECAVSDAEKAAERAAGYKASAQTPQG